VACTHRFRAKRDPCELATGPDGELCPWHNPRVDKAAAYVADTLAELIRSQDHADLEECHLVGLMWPGAKLTKGNLRGADLRDANLRNADLTKVDLRGAQLRRADLRGATLDNAQLDGADLTDANLGNVSMAGASMQGALIEGTVFNGADLRKANVSEALIESFYWNRLTRFSGIRGVEAKPVTDDATQPFFAPFAMGDHDISASRRSSLRDSDPDLERTRLYQAKPGASSATMPQPPPAPTKPLTDAVLEQEAVQTTASLAAARNQLLIFRKRNRQILVLLFLSLLVAVSLAAALVLRPPQRSNGTVTPNPDLVVDTAPTQQQQDLAFYRQEIARLTGDVNTAERARDAAERQLRSQEQREAQSGVDHRELSLENARLRASDDDAASLRRKLARLQSNYNDMLAQNRRLERTSSILAEGLDNLQRENERLTELTTQEQRDLVMIQGLEGQIKDLRTELANTKRQLDRTSENKISLEFDLRQAESAMDALVRRIQGTPLEALLGTMPDEAPILTLTPGEPLVLGGDVLLTLTVEHATDERIQVTVIAQGPPDQALPDISVILYGPDEEPMHKLGYSFPTQPRRPGFASASSLLEASIFPQAARVLVTPNAERELDLAER
jgi:uncharacterized protein YjbI with pentapeptide repeats